MTRRLPAVSVAFALAFVWFAASALGSSTVYWGNFGNSTLSFAAVNGNGGGQLSPTISPAGPLGLTIDTATGRVFWANAGGNSIGFTKLTGSGGGGLSTTGATVDTPVGAAIDPSTRRIYWANSADNTIDYANLNFTGGGQLDTSGATLSTPSGVAVDPARGKIYWANRGNNTISYANLDGSGGGGQVSIPSGDLDQPIGVAIDPVTGAVYWANNAGNTIGFISRNGSVSATLGPLDLHGPAGVAIDPRFGRLYWANNSDNTIAYLTLGGPHQGRASLVSTPGATANQPAFPVILDPPRPGAPPAISGGSTVGTTLTCSTGGWSPDLPAAFFYQAPSSFAYLWTRNGLHVGADSPTIVTKAPGSYVCHLTAANHAGAVKQKTASHAVS